MQKKISLIKLFLLFFKISCVLFGGGYAILPFLKSEIVEKERYCSIEEIADYYAISQCFPGLVAGNIAVLIGYKLRGFWGALASLIGVCLPAYLAIVLVYTFLSSVVDNSLTQNIFGVLDIAICVLIFLTVAELWTRCIVDKFTVIIFFIAFILSIIGVSPFIIVFSSVLVGLLKYFFFTKKILTGDDHA